MVDEIETMGKIIEYSLNFLGNIIISFSTICLIILICLVFTNFFQNLNRNVILFIIGISVPVFLIPLFGISTYIIYLIVFMCFIT